MTWVVLGAWYAVLWAAVNGLSWRDMARRSPGRYQWNWRALVSPVAYGRWQRRGARPADPLVWEGDQT